ncbi:phenylpyruvate tautomerase MIF-related protein [Clostridium hydrogenum]|uniref:phenylpyruvate tautomerase MIF-related protein n=1 Tax=Clostridium hydrogenum TaxID=2855764 RepID=UPI001F4382C5|nr:phenylpyruvate tautomerase MIF-related protein [Clostridium hydrogenum]
MPFINSKVTVKLDDEKKEKLKSELGNLISLIPGKSESWLMVGFNDNYSLYFKGEKKDKAAFVEVKIFGGADKEAKNKLTAEICSLFERELQIPQNSIYVTIEEITDWGWNGEMF